MKLASRIYAGLLSHRKNLQSSKNRRRRPSTGINCKILQNVVNNFRAISGPSACNQQSRDALTCGTINNFACYVITRRRTSICGFSYVSLACHAHCCRECAKEQPTERGCKENKIVRHVNQVICANRKVQRTNTREYSNTVDAWRANIENECTSISLACHLHAHTSTKLYNVRR